MDSGGVALFRLVRFWSRRWAQTPESYLPRAEGHVPHIMVLEAIASEESGGEPSISTVAAQLGIDHSVASRMVAQAVAAGYIHKQPSSQDARRTVLRPTPAGTDLLRAARAWQEQVFGELTAGWQSDDVERLAGYLQRLAREIGAAASESGRS
ncbi:MAG TPA: MarR family winged helix-turn-helix transcriptional regulator [Thermomicrobiales bacterium]|nr:MarR family winged helix-turn-helix transcriptional regulator [Thermomicrobiales bacterium]